MNGARQEFVRPSKNASPVSKGRIPLSGQGCVTGIESQFLLAKLQAAVEAKGAKVLDLELMDRSCKS